jgi:choline kinase
MVKALILAAGPGTRLRPLTETLPKCLIPIAWGQTILGRQLDLLEQAGIKRVIVAAGAHAGKVERFIQQWTETLQIVVVRNSLYYCTNYIYSMFLTIGSCDEDLLLLHGDLVFSPKVLSRILASSYANAVTVRIGQQSKRDFQAYLEDGRVKQIAVGLESFNCHFLAPIYKLSQFSVQGWFRQIVHYVDLGKVHLYAEDALNTLLPEEIDLRPIDIGNELCMEIDTPEDLALLESILNRSQGTCWLK